MNDQQEQTIEEWLDEKIAAYELLGKEFNPTGKEDYWKCPRVIEVHTSDKRIHVDRIHEIHRLLQNVMMEHRELEQDGDDRRWHEFSFVYKGYTFFQLEEVK